MLVDPRLMIWTPETEPLGFQRCATNIYKSHKRPEKVYHLYSRNFKTLILGSSRIDMGVPVNHPALGDKPYFIAAMPGASLIEKLNILDFALKHHKLERLIFFVDFYQLNPRYATHPYLGNTLISNSHSLFDHYANYIFAADQLPHAIKVISHNLRSRGLSCTDNIRTDGGYTNTLATDIRRRPNYRAFFDMIDGDFLSRDGLHLGHAYDPRAYEFLFQALSTYLDQGVEVDLVLPPFHAREYLVIERLEKLQAFIDFKSSLATLADRLQHHSQNSKGAARFAAMDCLRISQATQQPIPPAGEQPDLVHTFWIESIHFYQNLADFMFQELALVREEGHTDLTHSYGDKVYDNVCAPLGEQNFEAELAKFHAGLAAYKLAEPFEVEEIERLYEETAEERQKSLTYRVEGRFEPLQLQKDFFELGSWDWNQGEEEKKRSASIFESN